MGVGKGRIAFVSTGQLHCARGMVHVYSVDVDRCMDKH